MKKSFISVIILTMSENKYKEAWDYTMNEIHDFYKSQNNEDDFILWFNKMNYVEDTIDTITISVANPFELFNPDLLKHTSILL